MDSFNNSNIFSEIMLLNISQMWICVSNKYEKERLRKQKQKLDIWDRDWVRPD